MTDKIEVHVNLHYVLPAQERDLWNGQDGETKASWTPLTGQQDWVGEPTEYACLLPPGQIERFNEARNVRYCLPAVTATRHGDPKAATIDPSAARFPGQDTLEYHRAEEACAQPEGGEGVVYFHLDTGAGENHLHALDEGGHQIAGYKNFTSSGAGNDVRDRDGHGSMTLSLLLPLKSKVYIFKVLGDDGSGSSTGIVAAIREAARIASFDPSMKYILSGSLGGPPGQRFAPYEEACKLAEAFGVLCRWSAGNDGVGRISAPANWRQDRASIAFNAQHDRRAEFSNFGPLGGSAAHGEDILVIDRDFNAVRVNGTSFSLPFWNRCTGIVASLVPKASVFDVDAAELAAGRDTKAPVYEEPHGVLDVAACRNKLVPSTPAPPPEKPPMKRVSKSEFRYESDEDLKAAAVSIFSRRVGKLGVFRGVDS